MPQPKDGQSQLDFQTQKFMLNLFRKKLINKIKYSESSSDPDFHGVTISNHVIYYRFLPVSRHLCTTQENQNLSIRSRRISCNWGENFGLSQKERFLEPIEKSTYIVNDLWAGVSNIIFIALFWWSQIFIYFLFFILLQFCYWSEANLRRLVNSNISSSIFSLLKLHETSWFMN